SLRRVLLLASLVFAALPVCSALAATTVGQTGTPLSNTSFSVAHEFVQPSGAMPSAGVVTSFQTRSISLAGLCPLSIDSGLPVQGPYDFQVLRPLGSNQYRVLGDTGNHTDPCDGQLHSYPVHIPVLAGDVIGVYVVDSWLGVLSGGSFLGANFQIAPPAV